MAVERPYNFHEFGCHLVHGEYRDFTEYGVCFEPVASRIVSALVIAVAQQVHIFAGLPKQRITYRPTDRIHTRATLQERAYGR